MYFAHIDLGQYDNGMQWDFFQGLTYMGRRFEKEESFGYCMLMFLARHFAKSDIRHSKFYMIFHFHYECCVVSMEFLP
jgi:hypothetical protein